MEPAAYIRRETAVSIAINVALSAAFFVAVFGTGGEVPVWGVGGYIFDFGPQGFMIGLMATLVPGLLASKARRQGKVGAIAGQSRLPAAVLPRAVLCGVFGAACGVAGAGMLLFASGALQLAWLPALLAKLAFGAVLALLVTPAGLRAELTKR